MPELTRPLLAIALILPACGPGTDSSESSATTSAGPTTADTTAASSGTTADTPTTGEPTTSTTNADTGFTTGGNSCDPFPMADQPCTDEGTYCNSGCADQCQFCNILMCSEGTWHNLEAPPAPCLSCEEICPFSVGAMCTGGPPDQATCIAGCMDAMAGPCSIEFSALRACAGFEPAFTCDAMDRPLVVGCETQFDAFYTCSGL